jgi:hypothetical protein
MNGFTLYCLGEGGTKGEWTFEPFQDGMNVFDADDRSAGRFAHRHAQDRFVLPSFWRSIRHVGFVKDGGATVWFAPDRGAVADVKEYLEAALASQGEEAVRRLTRRGWIHVLGGLGVFAFGVVLIGIVHALFGGRKSAGIAGLAFVVLAGVGEAAWGASALLRAGRVRRRLRRGAEG